MRLSDIEEACGIRLFVKFVRSEFLDDLLDGNLFMSPLGDFINQEKREKIRGQGDIYEGAYVFGIIKAEIYDHETNQHIATATSGMVEETYSEIRKTPVFCFTKFSSDDFVLVEETEDQYLFKLSIPDEDKVKFLENFGDKAVLLPQDFPQIIKKMVDDTDDFCIVADARYDDYSKGINKQHKEDFDEGRLELVLWKDIFFKYQREVRLAFSTKPTEKPIKFNVGNIREKCVVRDSEDFFESIGVRLKKINNDRP